MAFLDRLGAAAPGAIKPAVGSLTEFLMDAHDDSTKGAAWILVRAARDEPAVVRPFIAERLWQLDATDPEVVADALHGLGAIGWVLPDEIPAVDRLYPHLSASNPDVRAAAIEAIGRIASRPPIGEAPYGFAAPDVAEPVIDAIVDGLDSSNDDVQTAALTTISWISRTAPELIESRSRALRSALPTDDPDRIETAVDIASRLSDPPVWTILAAADDFSDVVSVDILVSLLESNDDVPEPDDHGPILPLLFETLRDEELIDSRDLSDTESACLDLMADRAITTQAIDDELVDVCRAVSADPTDVTSGEIGLLTRVCLQVRTSDTVDSPPISVDQLLDAIADGLEDADRARRKAICRSVDRICSETTGYEQRCADIMLSGPFHTTERAATTGPLLAVADSHPEYVHTALQRMRTAVRIFEETRESDDSITVGSASRALDSALKEVCTEAPAVAQDRVEYVVDIVARAGPNAEAASRALIEIRKSIADPDPRVTDRLVGMLDRAVFEELFVPISVAILLGSPTDAQWTRAVRTIRSVIHRDYETLDTLSALDESCTDAIRTIEFDVGREVMKTHPEVAAAHITAAPDSTTLLQSKLFDDFEDIYNQVGSSTALTALVTVAEGTPAAAAGVSDVLGTLYLGGVTDMVCDGLKIVRLASGRDHETLQRWHHHPDPEIRAAVTETLETLRDRSHPLACEGEPEPELSRTASPIPACRQALGAGHGDRTRRALRRGVADGTVDRTAAVTCLLGHASRVGDREGRDDTLAAAARLANSDIDAEGPLADSGDAGADVTHKEPQTAIARCLTDESLAVRRSAASFLAIVGLPRGDETTDRLGAVITRLLIDSHPCIRERLLLLIDRHPSTVDLERVTPTIADALTDSFPVARVACDALRRACTERPDLVSDERRALEQALAAKDERTRQLAASVVNELGLLDPESIAPSMDRLMERVQTDSANRALLLRTIAGAKPQDLTELHGVVEAAQSLLLTDPDDLSAIHSAGRLLQSVARTDPDIVAAAIDESAAEELVDGEIDQLAVEYHLVRTLSEVAADHPDLVESFSEPIETTVESAGSYKAYRENTSERGELTVAPAAVREAAADAAGRAGASVFEAALEAFPTVVGRPELDPDAVAQYLLRTEPETRTDVLDQLRDNCAPELIESVCRSLAAISIDRAAIRWRRNRLAALGALLPEVTPDRVCRPAVEVVFSALDASNMDVRKDAVEFARPVWERGPLVADEWLARLFEVLRDHARPVQQAAAEQVPALVRRSYVDAGMVTEALVTRATADTEPVTGRRGATLALGAIGTQVPTARRQATEACLTCLDDPDRYVRRFALEALHSFADVSPALLTPIPDPVTKRREDGVPEVAAIADDLYETLISEQ